MPSYHRGLFLFCFLFVRGGRGEEKVIFVLRMNDR